MKHILYDMGFYFSCQTNVLPPYWIDCGHRLLAQGMLLLEKCITENLLSVAPMMTRNVKNENFTS